MKLKVGDIGINNFGTIMKVIEYKNKSNVCVEFQDDNKAIIRTYSKSFREGSIKNPFDKSVHSVGCLGNTSSKESGKFKKSYHIWTNILNRCYTSNFTNYMDVKVCDEWLCYANFEKWYDDNYYEISGENLNVDKDIKFKGNKIYSPQFCLLVPQKINLFFKKRQGGECAVGVSKHALCNYFTSTCNSIYLGLFKTEEEAFLSYKVYKERFAKDFFKTYPHYSSIIPKDTFNILSKAMNEYCVDIDFGRETYVV